MAFIQALQKYFESFNISKNLTKNRNVSLSHLLLKIYGVTILTLIDCRIIYASMPSALDIHNNIGHLESTDESILVRINLWSPTDYIAGLTSSGLEIINDSIPTKMLMSDDGYIMNEIPYITGYLGATLFWYCKIGKRI